MLTRQLTRPLSTDQFLTDRHAPPAFFYQVPRVADYFGTIEAMLLDDQVSSAMQLRQHTALRMPWAWSDDSDAAATGLLDQVFAEITLEHDLLDALQCLAYGFVPLEVFWSVQAGVMVPERIERSDPRRFQFHKSGHLMYLASDSQWRDVPDKKVIVFTHRANATNPYGCSVLEPAFPRWQAKWQALDQMQQLGDRYSVPAHVAISDATGEAELIKISQALAGLSAADSVTVAGVRDIKELSVKGKITEINEVIRDHDAAISKVITGQVLALDKGTTGSYAMSKTHQTSLESVAELDMKAVLRKLSRTLVAWVLELNQVAGRAVMVLDEQARQAAQAPAPGGAPLSLSAPTDLSLLV